MKLISLIACLFYFSFSFGENSFSKSSEQIKLLLAHSPQGQKVSMEKILSDFELLILSLKIDKLKQKTTKKIVEEVQEKVSRNYLKIYNTYSGFEDLWTQHIYNEITAAALYALLLERLEVRYKITTEPGSISVIVKPQTERIPIEIKAPKSKKIDDRFEKNYLELLRQMELIPPREYQSKSRKALFYQHYVANSEVVDLSQLAGMLSFNFALQFYERENYPEALIWARKACDLHPVLRHRSVKLAILYQLVAKINYAALDNLDPLFELLSDHPVEEVKNELIRQFYAFSESNNSSFESTKKLDACYQEFSKQLSKYPALLAELKEIYYYQKARHFAKVFNSEKELQFADSVYQLQPENSRVQEVLTKLVSDRMWEERNFEKGLERLNNYQKRFTFLQNQPFIKDLKLFYYSERVRHYFDEGKEEEGADYLKDFEGLLSGYGKTPMSNNWITTAYLAASAFYFRWGEYEKAREMIKKGLILMPDNAYFLHRYDVLFFFIHQKNPAPATKY